MKIQLINAGFVACVLFGCSSSSNDGAGGTGGGGGNAGNAGMGGGGASGSDGMGGEGGSAGNGNRDGGIDTDGGKLFALTISQKVIDAKSFKAGAKGVHVIETTMMPGTRPVVINAVFANMTSSDGRIVGSKGTVYFSGTVVAVSESGDTVITPIGGGFQGTSTHDTGTMTIGIARTVSEKETWAVAVDMPESEDESGEVFGAHFKITLGDLKAMSGAGAFFPVKGYVTYADTGEDVPLELINSNVPFNESFTVTK